MFWKRLSTTFEGKIVIFLGFSLVLFLLDVIVPKNIFIDNSSPFMFMGIAIIVALFISSIIHMAEPSKPKVQKVILSCPLVQQYQAECHREVDKLEE